MTYVKQFEQKNLRQNLYETKEMRITDKPHQQRTDTEIEQEYKYP